MDFQLLPEEEAVQKTVRKFVRDEVAPGAAERDVTGEFPYALVKCMGDLGYLGSLFPEEIGGSNTGPLSWFLTIEETAYADSSLAVTIQTAVGAARRTFMFGRPDQVEQYVKPIVRGEAIGAMAITEPNAGSDVSGISTGAILENHQWVINGTKEFITNSGTDITTFIIVVAVTGQQSNGRKEASWIIVPSGTPGFTVAPRYNKLGWRSSDTHALSFENCRVPEANLLGERGDAFKNTYESLNFGRLCLSSNALGLARACFDAAMDYAQKRKAFGQSISRFQHVQSILVEMATNIELGQLIRNKAAWLYKQNLPNIKEASMCKWFCTEAAVKAANNAVQIFGGMGFIEETPVARYYRDVKILTIGDGTSQIQQHIIARQLGC